MSEEIQRSLGRIEGTLIAIKEGMEKGTATMAEHDKRLGSLERKQHWYSGLAAGIGALLGVGGTHIPKF